MLPPASAKGHSAGTYGILHIVPNIHQTEHKAKPAKSNFSFLFYHGTIGHISKTIQ
jgi:hypothetical protein